MKRTCASLLRWMLAVWLLSASSAMANVPGVGDVPPDLVGSADGERILISQERGKVVIVTFWASWCPPCLRELPVLDRLQERVGRDRLRIIAVNFKEPRRQFLRLRERLSEAGSTLTWTHDANGAIGRGYGVRALPHMFMIDHEGRIAHVHRGYSEQILDRLVTEINELLMRQAGQSR